MAYHPKKIWEMINGSSISQSSAHWPNIPNYQITQQISVQGLNNSNVYCCERRPNKIDIEYVAHMRPMTLFSGPTSRLGYLRPIPTKNYSALGLSSEEQFLGLKGGDVFFEVGTYQILLGTISWCPTIQKLEEFQYVHVLHSSSIFVTEGLG